MTMNIRPEDIAFDFDGVVADTFRLFVRLAKENYNYDINYDDITDYHFLNVVNMEEKHALEIIDILTNEPHEIDLMPNEGAGEVLTRMTAFSPLLVVTARPVAEPIELWFERHIPQVGPKCLHVEATGVNTAKIEILKDKNIKYFIDDRLDTCFMLQEAGIMPIIYTQPWNRQPHPFHAVSSWADIAVLIDWNKNNGKNSSCSIPSLR
jgi:hypothetical protein